MPDQPAQRLALGVAYRGGAYQGWQSQPHGRTVQDRLEAALAAFAAQPLRTVCAGRTDAGVHAAALPAQLDLDRAHAPDRVRDALNFYTRPLPLAVLDASLAPEGWHARFSCTGRGYEYVILNRRAPAALALGRVWHIPVPLDAAAMHAAAQLLVGQHDFSSFRAAECQAKSPLKTLDELLVARDGERIVITARARSFLHHQVRNMVGTLAQVGRGRWGAADVAAILEARDRRQAGETAPAEGLTFKFAKDSNG